MPFDVKAALARALEAEKQNSIGCDTANPAKLAKQGGDDGGGFAGFASFAIRSSPNSETGTRTRADQEISVSLPDTPTKGDKSLDRRSAITFCRVLSGCRVEELEKNHGDKFSDPPQQSAGGRPVTWTGKVVSLDEWRRLSEWNRHGPNGRVWDGATQQWEASS